MRYNESVVAVAAATAYAAADVNAYAVARVNACARANAAAFANVSVCAAAYATVTAQGPRWNTLGKSQDTPLATAESRAGG